MLELKSGVELKERYVVQGEAGTGGYASVFRASDKQLNRSVALKRLLKRSLTHSAADVAALVQEAQLNAQLVHTNIVQVYEIIEVGGEHLIVMEYVDGQSLDALLRERALRNETLPLDTGIAIIREILSGVDFAHSKNICHRDLSPSNIFLTSGGTPKVGDFGIAKVVAPADERTPPGIPSQGGTGNANYMSPEQARGEPADFASDLFMVGIIGYLILAARHPFAHSSGLFTIQELLIKNDYNPPTPTPPATLSTTQQRLFREYVAVIMRLLQREKAGRFSSAREAIDAIDSVTPTLDCPQCGERVPDHHQFCGFCGAALSRSQPETIKAASTEREDDADELVERGYQHSLEKRWDAAIQSYKRAIAIDPHHKKAHRNLAFALNRVGRPEDALAAAQAGLAIGGLLSEHRASILYERTLAAQSLRQYDDALASIEEALRLKPDLPRLRYQRAKTLELLGRQEEAERDAREVLRRIPDHAGALRMLEQYHPYATARV